MLDWSTFIVPPRRLFRLLRRQAPRRREQAEPLQPSALDGVAKLQRVGDGAILTL
jgi:hypothetical protein